MSERLNVTLINGRFPNYYGLLKIDRNASQREITVAYRKKALDLHPDKAGGGHNQNETFAHINNAKDVLTNPEKRKQYDAQLTKVEAAAQAKEPQVTPSRSSPAQSTTPNGYSTRPPPYSDPELEKPHGSWWTGGSSVEGQCNRGTVDPNYCPKDFPVTFDRFCPPASAYAFDHIHSGTRPPSLSEWSRFMHEGVNLGRRHDECCLSAIRLCYIAEGIHRMILDLQNGSALHINKPNLFKDPGFLHSRLACAVELLVEVMHFAAASYYAHKTSIDMALIAEPKVALIMINQHARIIEQVTEVMSGTRLGLSKIVPKLRTCHISAAEILTDMQELIMKWDAFCELPQSLKLGIHDTFFAPLGLWTNTWPRRRRMDKPGSFEDKHFKLTDRGKSSRPPASSEPKRKESKSGASGKQNAQQPGKESHEQWREQEEDPSDSDLID